MQFFYEGTWQFWAPAACGVLLALSVATWLAPWKMLISSGVRQHVFGLSIIVLAVFWQLKVEVRDLFILHPLLMMWVVIVFGGSLGLWVGSLAFLLTYALAGDLKIALAVPLLFSVVVPVCVATIILKIIERISWRNVFVFMLGGGFIGAMITVQAMAFLQWLYIGAFGPAPLWVIASDNYYLTLLMMFPEGFINGALVTVLTIFTPDLVKTYDDRHYLDGNQ